MKRQGEKETEWKGNVIQIKPALSLDRSLVYFTASILIHFLWCIWHPIDLLSAIVEIENYDIFKTNTIFKRELFSLPLVFFAIFNTVNKICSKKLRHIVKYLISQCFSYFDIWNVQHTIQFYSASNELCSFFAFAHKKRFWII